MHLRGVHRGWILCKAVGRPRLLQSLRFHSSTPPPSVQHQSRASTRAQQHSVRSLASQRYHSSYRRSNNSSCRGMASARPTDHSAAPEKPSKMRSHFCRMCGGKLELAIPDTEAVWRHVCTNCAYVDYFNPKMVVGCIVEHEGRILLCKRAIEPCKGLWTVPAGYMELNESSAEGAVRETFEEANAQVEVLGPYSHFDIPIIGQAYILFRAKLLEPYTYGPGVESLETVMFRPDEIPFDKVAFSSIAITLQHYVEDMRNGRFHVHHGVIEKRAGSGPNDPSSFVVRDHFAVPTELSSSAGTSAVGDGNVRSRL